MDGSTLQEVAEVVGAIGGLVSAVGVGTAIYFGYRQLENAKADRKAQLRATQAQTLLAFDQMLDRYSEVHNALRNKTEPWEEGGRAVKDEEWPEVERYIGLFERAKIFLDDGLLEVEDFDHLYGYRVRNIANNPVIKAEKLVKNAWGWTYFNSLVKDLERARTENQNRI